MGSEENCKRIAAHSPYVESSCLMKEIAIKDQQKMERGKDSENARVKHSLEMHNANLLKHI